MQTKKIVFITALLILLSVFFPAYAARPTVKISASPLSIVVGGSSTLTWTSTGATSASINQGIGSVPVNGSLSVSPTATKTYTITVKNGSGTTTAKTTVTVKAAPPTVTFSAAPGTIQPGQSSTLSWTTTNATSASINQGIGTVALNGTKTVSPTATKIYTITIKGSGGTVTAQATVTVQAAPPVVSFNATPNPIEAGQSSTLSWTTSNATAASIDQGIGSVVLNGSKTVTPTVTTTYSMTATGSGGTVTASTTITVNAAPPTVAFSATPTTIETGQSSTLSWTISNATSASIDNDIGSVALNGSKTVSPVVTTIYTLTAIGNGGTVTTTATVTVNKALPKVTLTVNPQIIQLGETAILSWTSANADSAILDTGIGAVEVNGSLPVSPTTTTTYTIIVTGAGESNSASVTITVSTEKPCYAFIPDAYDKKIRIINTNTNTLFKIIEISDSNAKLQGIGAEKSGVFVYAVDTGQTKLFQIDPLTMTVADTLSLTASFQGSPKSIAVAPDGCYLYSTSSVPMWEPSSGKYVGAICTIKASENYLSAIRLVHIELPNQVSLEGLAVSNDSKRLYVADPDNSQILVLDTAKLQRWAVNPIPITDELITTIPLASPPLELAVSPSGQTLYAIANSTLFEIDAQNYTVTRSLAIPSGSSFIKLHPDGSKIYIVTSNSLSIVDTAGLTKTATVGISGLFWCTGFDIHPDGSRLFMVDKMNDKLITVDSSTYQVLTSITLGTTPTAYGNFLSYLPISIAGNVKQDGNGLSGVTMTLDGEGILRTKQTAAAGDFIFGLKPGNYQLTPIISNLAFTPEDMDLQVTEKMTGLDFTVSGIVQPPTVTLTASSSWLKPFESFTLTWASTGVEFITLSSSNLPPNGSRTLSIGATQTYLAKANNRGGTASASVTVFISNAPPPTASINAAPNSILLGANSTLSWSTTNASTVTIDNGIGTVSANGSRIVSPAATTTYTITATNSRGYQVTSNVTVVVTIVPPPTITLTALPEVLPPGSSSTLTWASTNATSVSIDNGIGTVDLSGNRTVSPLQDTVFTATATGLGGTATASVTVKTLDSHLRSIWSGMKTALKDLNIEAAVGYFSSDTQQDYLEIFSTLSASISTIASEMQEIEPVYFEESGAQYRIKRMEEIEGIEYDITYYIYFSKDENGNWNIYRF